MRGNASVAARRNSRTNQPAANQSRRRRANLGGELQARYGRRFSSRVFRNSEIFCHAAQNFPKEWEKKPPMKTNAKSFLILFVLITVAFFPARAASIRSTYIGPIEGNWGDPANWSPPVVPNNDGEQHICRALRGCVSYSRSRRRGESHHLCAGRFNASTEVTRRFSSASITISPPYRRKSALEVFLTSLQIPRT